MFLIFFVEFDDVVDLFVFRLGLSLVCLVVIECFDGFVVVVVVVFDEIWRVLYGSVLFVVCCVVVF